MEPITRKEMYLAKMSGDYSGNVPEPVTRMDYYMAYAAGAYSGPLPKPIRQQEFYWAYICGATDIELPTPITRVDMYLAAICGGMILLLEPITREEIYLAKIAKQNQYVVKSAAGKTIVLTDSLEAPFEDFKIYGRTTQQTTTGANLLSHDGNVLVNASGDLITDKETISSIVSVKNIDTVYISGDFGLLNSGVVRIGLSDGTSVPQLDDVVERRTLSAAGAIDVGAYSYIVISLKGIYSNGKVDFYAIKNSFALNVGDTALPWEPYTGGIPSPNPEYPQELVSAGDKGSIEMSVTDGADNIQSLTMLTTNGLPGIPVSSGGNYIDENSQQWIADYRDWERGVDVQCVAKLMNDFFKTNRESIGNGLGIRFLLNDSALFPEDGLTRYAMCSSYIYESQIGETPTDGKFYVYKDVSWDYTRIRFSNNLGFSTWDEFDIWLDKQNFCVMYPLATPIETPIPAEELAAYRALRANYPTTTITNDEDCWMEVGYKAKPISQYSEAVTLEYLKEE